MSSPKCGVCGAKMMKNGKTEAGTQRWRCGRCGASSVRKIDSAAKALAMFVRWLLGKLAQCELGIPARTFRDKTARFWSLWPILPACDEVRHFVYMDGIWLVRNKAVVLIACTDAHVIGCHLAKSENAKDWACLMQRIAAPDVLVCDGAGGIGKAMRAVWPETRMQRCTFHVFRQVKRCTTTRPKTQAGVDLYAIAKDLMRVEDNTEAAVWMARFQGWCAEYEGLLRERSETDRRKYRHERLRKARRALVELCNAGTLFTYLDEDVVAEGAVPSTSNRIENLNGRIRRMLSLHRGMSIDRRVKAVFWFCYMESEAPVSAARMLREFPTDEDVKRWRIQAARQQGDDTGAPARWGEGLVWSEFHRSTPYPYGVE
ncbi:MULTISPECIES: IS1249 family transposase [unclassified Adlercreutzia]|uniref:IS1249 family transposase n=1 Tax=unclassified Adlercreutzia TaxID=2636013 RepID=UPI0013EE2B71|nr:MULTISPECIES: IS1249 family transposase [unclassified Adlercreutzia]